MLESLDERRRHASWTSALDDLEANVDQLSAWLATEDVDSAASALVFENTAWTAPDLPWLIPTELVPRAQAIAMRQADVRRELEHRMHAVHKQLRLVRQLDQGAQLSTPAYVDMQA